MGFPCSPREIETPTQDIKFYTQLLLLINYTSVSLRVLLRLESEGPEGLGVLAVEDSCELAAEPEALEAYKHKQPTVNNSAPYQVQTPLARLFNDNVFLSEVHVLGNKFHINQSLISIFTVGFIK